MAGRTPPVGARRTRDGGKGRRPGTRPGTRPGRDGRALEAPAPVPAARARPRARPGAGLSGSSQTEGVTGVLTAHCSFSMILAFKPSPSSNLPAGQPTPRPCSLLGLGMMWKCTCGTA